MWCYWNSFTVVYTIIYYLGISRLAPILVEVLYFIPRSVTLVHQGISYFSLVMVYILSFVLEWSKAGGISYHLSGRGSLNGWVGTGRGRTGRREREKEREGVIFRGKGHSQRSYKWSLEHCGAPQLFYRQVMSYICSSKFILISVIDQD